MRTQRSLLNAFARNCSPFGLLLALAAPSLCLAAAAGEFAEYQLKAGYLYNFVSYTEWPASTPATLNLCVYGSDPFGTHLDSLVGKVVDSRTISVIRVNSVDLLAPCHTIFVTKEAISNLPRLQEAIAGRAVLLVSDSPGAAASGIAINMITEDGKVSFEINLKEAQQRGLQLSFQLLRLAREVLN